MKFTRSAWFVLAAALMLLLPMAAQAQDMTDMSMSGDSSPALEPGISKLIAEVRNATEGFRAFDAATEMGYGKFLDCFTNTKVGGMGQHYVNGDLAGDALIDPMKPEALVYEPTSDGRMILVAFEYLVFASKWDPENIGRPAPVIFGRPMHLMTTIPKTPPVWALHLWLWTDNPDGIFADFNPTVFCPTDQPITDMTPAS